MEGGEEDGGAAEGRGVDGGYKSGEEGWGEVEVLFGEMGKDLSLWRHDIARFGGRGRGKSR
jgi:hypothetical protein